MICLLINCTHRLPFHRAQEAFEIFAGRREGAIKVLLEF